MPMFEQRDAAIPCSISAQTLQHFNASKAAADATLPSCKQEQGIIWSGSSSL